MWINRKEYEVLKQEAEQYRKIAFSWEDLKENLGIATGCTVSYNMMRDLVEEICQKLDAFGAPRYALEYRQKAENIDKVAWHHSIARDACIGGYDWLFKDLVE